MSSGDATSDVLEAGATADVLVVEGDPSKDIHALARVSRVYREGDLVNRRELALPGWCEPHAKGQPLNRCRRGILGDTKLRRERRRGCGWMACV